MVDFTNRDKKPDHEPNFDDPITSLNLTLSKTFDCWPLLTDQWESLSKQTTEFVRNRAYENTLVETKLDVHLSAAIGNFTLLKMNYEAKQLKNEDKRSHVGRALEKRYRERGDKKLGELEEILNLLVANKTAQTEEFVSELRAIVTRVRQFHDSIGRLFDDF